MLPRTAPSAARSIRSSEPAAAGTVAPRRLSALLGASYWRRTLVVVLYGTSWGLVNWGFVTFLPTYLARAGLGTRTNDLLFLASLFAPASIVVAAVRLKSWGVHRSIVSGSSLAAERSTLSAASCSATSASSRALNLE